MQAETADGPSDDVELVATGILTLVPPGVLTSARLVPLICLALDGVKLTSLVDFDVVRPATLDGLDNVKLAVLVILDDTELVCPPTKPCTLLCSRRLETPLAAT